jgi:hypothetical protein
VDALNRVGRKLLSKIELLAGDVRVPERVKRLHQRPWERHVCGGTGCTLLKNVPRRRLNKILGRA